MTTTTFEADTAYRVPPGSLLLERNIRDSTPSADLIDSVTQLGVLEPITAVLKDDGRLLVRFGHRRVMAAVAAGLDTVPVYVAGVDDRHAEVDRIIRQRDENTHRAGLTAADEAGVVEQLVAFGLTVDEISAQARISKDRVKAAVKITGSQMAREHAQVHTDLTLDQAAAIAEFEDDPEAVIGLVNAAQDGRFDHTVQRMRDDRRRAEEREAAIAKLKATGVKVIDQPEYDSKTKRLDRLVHAKTEKDVTLAQHKKCPGHVAWIGWNNATEYGCTDPTKNGHRDRYASGGSKPAAADMTEAERAAAKAARRLIIDNNKAWASAETVRRQWLATFAKYKTAPKGTGAFITDALVLDSGLLINDYRADPDKLAAEWLGLKTDKAVGKTSAAISAAAAQASEARAVVIALVNVLANYELKATDRQQWRHNGTDNATGRYLRFLATCGYQLSEVEEFAISKRTA